MKKIFFALAFVILNLGVSFVAYASEYPSMMQGKRWSPEEMRQLREQAMGFMTPEEKEEAQSLLAEKQRRAAEDKIKKAEDTGIRAQMRSPEEMRQLREQAMESMTPEEKEEAQSLLAEKQRRAAEDERKKAEGVIMRAGAWSYKEMQALREQAKKSLNMQAEEEE